METKQGWVLLYIGMISLIVFFFTMMFMLNTYETRDLEYEYRVDMAKVKYGVAPESFEGFIDEIEIE